MNNGFVKISKSVLKFLEPLSVEKTSEIIVREGLAITGANYGSILLSENEGLKRIYSNLPTETLSVIKEKGVRKRGFTFQSFKKRKILVKHQDIFRRYHPEIAKLGIKTDIFIPLSYKNHSIGTLTLNFQEKKNLQKNDREILKLLGSMASLAVRKSQLYQETKTALDTRNLFISTAAHEIRTPVTTIFGYAQLLLNNAKTGKELKFEWLDALSGECNRLRYLINDLLEASHIHAGYIRYSYKECRLKEIIKRAVNNFNFNHANHKLIVKDLIQDDKDTVIGDYDRLMQALINLLDNAAKFSPAGSKVLLSVKKDDSNFVIRVKDKGKGISKTDLQKVFDRYYRGGGAKYEGLGLGLFLVKNIIEHHHGSIELKSKLNKGTTAELRLPARKVGESR